MWALWEKAENGWRVKDTCPQPDALHKAVGLLQVYGSGKKYEVLPEGQTPDGYGEPPWQDEPVEIAKISELDQWEINLKKRLDNLEKRIKEQEEINSRQETAINLLVEALKTSQEIISRLGD